jgi:transposase
MTIKRRQFTKEFKLHVLREIETGKTVVQAAREYQVHPNTIPKWRQLYARYADRAFAGNGHPYTDEAKIAELERLIGQLTIENTFLKKVLSRLEHRERR